MPAGSDKDFKFVVIDDFSPGIYDDWYAASGAQPAPPGAAQLTGTYGCVSSVGGGLIPAPRRVNRIQEAAQSSTAAGDPYTHIMAFRSLSPVYDRTGVSAGVMGIPRAYPDELFFAYEYYTNDGKHSSIIGCIS